MFGAGLAEWRNPATTAAADLPALDAADSGPLHMAGPAGADGTVSAAACGGERSSIYQRRKPDARRRAAAAAAMHAAH